MSEQLRIDFASAEERQKVAAVLAVIRPRRGREAAVTGREISERTGVNERAVQAIVKFLVEERQIPIGTATSRPFGYFILTTDRERRACRDSLIRRALSTLNHAKAFDQDGIVAPLVGQAKLALEQQEER